MRDSLRVDQREPEVLVKTLRGSQAQNHPKLASGERSRDFNQNALHIFPVQVVPQRLRRGRLR